VHRARRRLVVRLVGSRAEQSQPGEPALSKKQKEETERGSAMVDMIISLACSLTVLLGLWFIEWRSRKIYVASGKER